MKLNPQAIIFRAQEIANADSEIQLALDIKTQAAIHAICEALENEEVVQEISGAQEVLEIIAVNMALYRSNRLSWRETLDKIHEVLVDYTDGDKDD